MKKDDKAWGSFLGIVAMGGVSLAIVFAVGVGILIGHYAIGSSSSTVTQVQPSSGPTQAQEQKAAEKAAAKQQREEAAQREEEEAATVKKEEEAETEAAQKEEEAAAGKKGATTGESGTKAKTGAPASGTAVAQGEQIFTTTCATCHTLAAAKTSGTVGPDLDQLKPNYETVKHQVTYGGGVMPAFGQEKILTPAEVEAVAKYVSTVAGKS